MTKRQSQVADHQATATKIEGNAATCKHCGKPLSRTVDTHERAEVFPWYHAATGITRCDGLTRAQLNPLTKSQIDAAIKRNSER